jgi:serine/threonine-protein kinase HipA
MKLAVWAQERQVGHLAYEMSSGRFSFEYSQQWLAWPQGHELSPSLPLASTSGQTADQHSAAVRQFFENLLPEGQALDDAARTNQLSKANLTGLLYALGREMAGSLVITQENQNPRELPMPPRPLPAAELSKRIRERPELPFSIWDGKVRLSIAGYQDKLAVYEHQDQWFLVEDPTLASTHIIKPEPLRHTLAGMTSNELLCLRLADKLGLNCARAWLKKLPEPVLVIERFDRVVMRDQAGLQVERIACIDGCQVLGLPVGHKYERPFGDGRDVRDIRDGASLKRFFALLANKEKVGTPASARLQFLRWVIFQVLIGNTDAHAKNVSFFSDSAGLRLAPAYDLVCGLVFSDVVASTMAMAIGDNFDPRGLGAYDWAQMARQCGLAPRLVAKELQRMASEARAQLPALTSALKEEGADEAMMTRVAQIVVAQCEGALKAAPEIPKIGRDLLE